MLKLRHLLFAGLLLASVKSNACHIEYHTTTGCITLGQPLQIGAKVAAASGSTYYQWQYKGSSGGWNYFTPVTGSNTTTVTINGQSYTVSGTAGGPSAYTVPTLKFNSPNANLDGVQVRVIMRNDGYPVNSASNNSAALYGGDDENIGDTKMFRLRYESSGACTIQCTNNMLTAVANSTDIDDYYGGFEMVDYNNGTFTNNNFLSGRGSSDYTANGSNAGSYKVMNNPYAAYGYTSGKFAPHSGNYQMIIKGSTNASHRIWYKTVSATVGQVYSFSAWVAGVDGTASNVQLVANGSVLGAASISTSSVGTWIQINGTYTVTTAGNVEFSIKNSLAASGTGGADNFVIDDICLTVQNPITIGDFVWFDVNRDGKQDSGEPGISGVTVNLWADANNDNIADAGTPFATATTNANGLYSFTNIPRGKYFVQFPTSVNGYTGLTTQDASGVAVGSNSTANVTSGKTGTHDFSGDYFMKDAGYVKNITISGTAFNDPTALTDNTVNGTGISTVSGQQLYANLFRGTTFVASTAVSGGTYTFSNLPGNTAYTVAISTVAATSATTTVTSTLPSGWMNTGEFIGTGAGNDGVANGVIAVSLAAASIGNVNFGMQQPPVANVATLPVQLNPGGNNFVTVPAINFGGVDSGGAISAIKITSFPTNTTTLKVNNVDYTSANFASLPNIPTNAAGQPTQAIAVDPVDGGVSVQIPYKTIDNGGATSSNTGSVTVPFNIQSDLTPLILANPSTMNGVTNFNVTIKVSEVAGTASSGLITVLVPKDSRISFTYNSSLTTIGSPATALNNSNWSLDNTNPYFYIFTSTTAIPANGFSTIGFAAQFNPQNAQGVYVLSSIITSGSGGEIKTSNNSSSVSLNYFAN